MRTIRNRIYDTLLIMIMALLVAVFQGCGKEADKPQPELISISVEPKYKTIEPGLSAQFEATGLFSDSSKRNVTNEVIWVSSNTNVATIDAKGLATGVWGNWLDRGCDGLTTITAFSSTVSGQANLHVIVYKFCGE